MIDLNPETVRNVINIAREFQTEADMDEDTEPVAFSGDEDYEQLAEWRGDDRFVELKNVIEDLEPDQQRTLVALAWVGRGDYDIEEWEEALKAAAEGATVSTADYLIATPLLADYLEEGLSQHGYEEE
ncbi:MAG: DUF3775 domain-containing protein [Pseudomonadales bacterium]|jgi:hypothetical protein